MSFLGLADLKETSIDVGVVVDGAVLVVAHYLDHFTYATVFLFVNASSSSALPWKRPEKSVRCLTIDCASKSPLPFHATDFSSAPVSSFVLELFGPRETECPSGSPETTTEIVHSPITRRHVGTGRFCKNSDDLKLYVFLRLNFLFHPVIRLFPNTGSSFGQEQVNMPPGLLKDP